MFGILTWMILALTLMICEFVIGIFLIIVGIKYRKSVTGATKKKTNTSATTTTHITSSLKPILKANIQITPNGAKKVAYSVTPNKKSVSTSKTWHYTGKKKYIAVKTAVQVTTSMGVSPNGSSAGGVTLGK
ncbi:TPA: hypothetical protein ACIQMB_002831 [Bacillus pacificus]